MTIDLHLFSEPGQSGIEWIVDGRPPYLDGRSDPTVAYLPAAALDNRFLPLTRRSFAGLADNGYLRATTVGLSLIRGDAWWFAPGRRAVKLAAGPIPT